MFATIVVVRSFVRAQWSPKTYLCFVHRINVHTFQQLGIRFHSYANVAPLKRSVALAQAKGCFYTNFTFFYTDYLLYESANFLETFNSKYI